MGLYISILGSFCWEHCKEIIMLNEFINYILNDKRMNNLFDGIKPICLQIWLLELQERSQVDYHLLYGRVLPYDYQNNQWISDLSKQ